MSSALIGVINQRLVRRLCSACRRADTSFEGSEVPERIRDRMQGSEISAYRAGGCHLCHEGGYDSLVNMPEIMLVNSELEDAIANRTTAIDLESIAIEKGMLRLSEVAHSYVLRGITSVDEANRVINDSRLAQMHRRELATDIAVDE